MNLKKFEDKGIFIYSLNQGINGDTTRLGLLRINDVYNFKPDIVIMQFGYNDCNYWVTDSGFPRVNIDSFKFNIIELIDKFKANKIKQESIDIINSYFRQKRVNN